jgi:hypothetical protein
VGQKTGRNRCGEPTCTSRVACSRTRLLLHFLIASPPSRVLRNSSGTGTGTDTGTGRAQGAPHHKSQQRSETRRQVLHKRPAPVGALHGPPIQAGWGQARNTTPAANHAPILPIACPPLDVAAQRPQACVAHRLECMMRCGPPHHTSRRSQHASCLACTALPSDVCGEMGPSLVTRQPLVCFSVRDAHGCLHAAHHNPQYPQRDQQCKYRYARNEPDIISICLSYGIALQPGLRRQKLLLRSVRSTLRVNFAGGAASRYSVTGSMPRAIVDAT